MAHVGIVVAFPCGRLGACLIVDLFDRLGARSMSASLAGVASCNSRRLAHVGLALECLLLNNVEDPIAIARSPSFTNTIF